MGQELDCRLHYQGSLWSGRAQLEGDHILFRGDERIRIHFRDVSGVSARDGVLHLELHGGAADFELGAAAEKWARKIQHPPTRAEKLGIREGLTVRVEGEFPADLLKEVEMLPAAGAEHADLIFLAAPEQRALEKVAGLAAALQPAGALWVVYPKGVAAIREIDVIQAGRAAGLKDVKVVSFSATHTGLRFVIPVAARPR